MKFTEERFKKLVEIQEDQYSGNLYLEPKSTDKSIEYTVKKFNPDLHRFIWEEGLYNEAVALMNPLTREWARDQYVEKEKRYFWSTKKKNKQGKPMVLFNGAGGVVQMMGPKQALTESEIREWGYDPERFDKEEVE